jgi:2-oxoisovalerate dehydrogenase E1 component
LHFDRKQFTDEELIHFYRSILYPRMIEEKMLLLLRQGRISKWFSGIGQEAIATGVALALDQDEWVMPLHRNLGLFTTRGIPLSRLFAQWQGSPRGFSKGRERSFHFGSSEYRICGMISHLGPQLSIANGVALAHKLRGSQKVAVAFTGEGGTSEGDFHEALNIAAVWDLPVIFIIENNGYALSTPVKEQYRCDSLVDKARGYGMEGVKIDGNNLLTVIDTVKGVREYCLKYQKPYLIECMTFRMRGHEEASGTKYIPEFLFEMWKQKDPVVRFEQFLIGEGIIDETISKQIHDEVRRNIEEELSSVSEEVGIDVNTTNELEDVYAAAAPHTDEEAASLIDTRYIDAISSALRESMRRHEDLILMGQDIAEYGGAFKITEGFVAEFGRDRVRNTPLCESGIIGCALGLALEGYRSVIEMQFADFVTAGFTQIVNNLAKIHYRWGQPANVVIRMPTGAGVGAGPFHSQSNEAWFVHTPGLKVVYPATAYDAKGLLNAAIEDPNPVMFFEHKALYRTVVDPVPAGYYSIPIGRARIVRSGDEISIITYGAGVHWAIEYAEANPDVSVEIVDLRTLLPFDTDTIAESVKQTGKVLVLHEDTLTGGIGAEIAAWIGEHLFNYLDAPVVRCASLDTPVPFNIELEKNFLAKSRLDTAIRQLLDY